MMAGLEFHCISTNTFIIYLLRSKNIYSLAVFEGILTDIVAEKKFTIKKLNCNYSEYELKQYVHYENVYHVL